MYNSYPVQKENYSIECLPVIEGDPPYPEFTPNIADKMYCFFIPSGDK